jgi:tetratricopeptide (TPR) repeat protein
MLSAIFGKKSDNPLADIKSAQALLEDLPKTDAFRSLAELTELVELLSEQAEFKLDHQLAVLRLFDEAAQPYVRKLVREYFTPFEISKFQENRLWLTLGNWSRKVATAYFGLFTAYCNGEKGSSAIKAQLPLLAARSVHTLMWQLKFICAHYDLVDNTAWDNLARLYRHAEQLGYLEMAVSLYPGMIGNTSVKSEVGILMVWYDSGLSALSPLYIHLIERIVAQYRATIDIHPEISQHSRLSFDLSRPSEPTRINMGATTHPAMRFVGIPAMQARLEDLMKVLNKNIVPDDINLGGNYEAEVVKNAAQYLLNYVIAPPVRRNKRRLADITLNVVDGFDKVIERTGAGLNFGEGEAAPARWVTEEISSGGFSAVIPAKGNGSIGIGSLLGIQPDGLAHWGIAVVRRLLRDDAKNQLRVGAEILSNQIAGVVLNQNRVPGGAIENGQPALWLYARQNDASGEAQLLMRADTFSPGRSLQIQLDGKNYLLMSNGLQEKGLDFDLAKFRFVVQETGEE